MSEEVVVPEEELPPVPMDGNVKDWKLAEQMAYRDAIKVNPQYAMLMIGRALESEDAAQFTNIEPNWLLGIAWITARRTDKSITREQLAEELEYSRMLDSIIEWAMTRMQEESPTKAPTKAPRKRNPSAQTRKSSAS